MWIMLLLFPASVFATVLDTEEECDAMWLVNSIHFAATGQVAVGMCSRTLEA